MKKLLIIAAAILSFGAANAQVAYIGYQNVSGRNKIGSTTTVNSYSGMLVGGSIINYEIYQGIGVLPALELNFYTRTEDHIKDTSVGLRVPVDFNYGFDVAPGLKVYGYAGPSFYLGLYRNQSVADVDSDWYDGKWSRFGFGFGFGAWCDWRDALRLKLGFDLGLNDRSESSVDKYKENTFSITLGYIF